MHTGFSLLLLGERMKKLFSLCVTVGFLAQPTFAQTQLYGGEYVATIGSGCAVLVIASAGFEYTYADPCGGPTSYVGTRVVLEGATIRVDDATLAINSATENEIAGHWTLYDFEADVVFTRR